jgi:hypothetical protein
MEAVTVQLDDYTPDGVLPVDKEFTAEYSKAVEIGAEIASRSSVVFVGMARQIGEILPVTIARLERIGSRFSSWSAVVVENDSTDDTKEVLRDWQQRSNGRVLADCRDLGREHLHGFESTRVERYAEYRNRYLELAKAEFGEADYVVAVDMDPWGGYSSDGVMHSVYELSGNVQAGCMASTSIYRASTDSGKLTWAHYDLWALRIYGAAVRFEPWQPLWLPPPGASPIPVVSAFGALATYKAEAFFNARYRSIDGDIEHVGFHLDMASQGWGIFLNPASRVVMHWLNGLTEGV